MAYQSQNGDVDHPEGRWEFRRAVLEVAWQRKSLVLLGVAIGMVLGLLYYANATPVYKSKAQILVVKKRPDDQTGINTRNLAIEDYVATHQTLIRSPKLVGGAILKRDLTKLDSLANVPEADVMDEVLESLTVTRSKIGAFNSNILDLSYSATKGSDCAVILNAIIESYNDFLQETYRSTSQQTLSLIGEARDGLAKELEDAERSYEEFRNNAPILLSRAKEGGNSIHETLSTVKKAQVELLLRRSLVESYLTSIDEHLKNGNHPQQLMPTLADWRNKLDGDAVKFGQTFTLNNQMLPLLLEYEKLMESRGTNHPEVVALKKRIDVTREHFSSPTASWGPATAGTVKEPSAKESLGTLQSVEAYRAFFREELRHIEVTEKKLAKVYADEKDEAKGLINYEHKDETIRTGIDRKQKLYDAIIKKLHDVEVIKDVGGYDAQTIAPPVLGKQTSPRKLIVFGLAMLGGLVSGLGLAYLAEISDKGFHTVDEIRRRLGVTVVGQIPHLDATEDTSLITLPNGRMLDPMLCVHYHPKSPDAECFRGVRTALFFSTQGGHKVIQVTSPNGGDGKSTVTANLAISIAQAGKKVILIDADLRKPRVHKIFGMSARIGLASILMGDTDPQDAIQESGIPGLSILPTGPLPPNPAELLTSIRLKELLDSLRDQYDFVLVDTPPLLVVTDPSVVAPRVDGVLLNIRLTKNARPQAERAKAILETLGVTLFGVIVNDAESRANYGHYSYSNSYYYTSDAETEATSSATPPKNRLNGDAEGNGNGKVPQSGNGSTSHE